jgi:molecular chaperone HtpG
MTAEVEKYINQLAFSGAEEFLKNTKTLQRIQESLVTLVLVSIRLYGSFKVEIITKSYKDEPAAHWICDGSPNSH